MTKVAKLNAQQILDSRGQPTLEVQMTSVTGAVASFGVPAGASTGKHEAKELRDHDREHYKGLGEQKAVGVVGQLAKELVGVPLGRQVEFDKKLIEMDGSSQKKKLGGNTILGISGAYLRLSALDAGKELWRYIAGLTDSKPAFPRLFANVINGGKHAPGLSIQEFMLVSPADPPSKTVEQIVDAYHELADVLSKRFGKSAVLVGDEGGYAPSGATSEDVWQILKTVAGDKLDLACDAAASSFFSKGNYQLDSKKLSRSELVATYAHWVSKYSLLSIEDPFGEDDLEGFSELRQACPELMIVGDDVSVTRSDRIRRLASNRQVSGVIIKPNQVGTISETFDAISAARELSVKVIVSHRSGETNDDFIADLAYGVGAYGFKLGAPARGEHIAKYDRLLAIERTK